MHFLVAQGRKGVYNEIIQLYGLCRKKAQGGLLMSNVKRLSLWTKLKFGVADFGISAIGALIQFFMLFYYTDVVHISPGLAGTAMLVGKLTWDMINDVLFGYICDRTVSRWGRRRPYLIFCAVPMMLTFWLLLSIPEGLTGAKAFFAILLTSMLFDTVYTLVCTAYSAMTAELTLDYDERTSLTTCRMIFNILGYLCGAGATTLLASIISSRTGMSDRQAWSIVGLAFGALAMVTTLIPGLFLNVPPVVNAEPTRLPPVKAFVSTLKNKPFVQYLAISMTMSTAFTMVTTMLSYYMIYQLDMADSLYIVMFLMLGVLALFLVPCSRVSAKLGKAKTYALGITIASAGLICAFFLQGQSILIYILASVVGMGFSSQWVCPHSMMPDVIEYDELVTGERREGIYFGMNATAGKITGALGSAICGWGLELSGYVEGAVQSAEAMMAIRGMFALVPAVLLFVCVPMLLHYPITREKHAQVLAQLEQRRKENAK